MKSAAKSQRAPIRARAWSWLMALMALCGCIGTETTNPANANSETEPGLSGTLVDGAGAPVRGATIKAFPAGDGGGEDAGVAKDSALTNAMGRYHIPPLPGGAYNLVGEYRKDDINIKVFIPGIFYQGSKVSLDIGEDTLRTPGRIQGSVAIAGGPRKGVFCSLPGTPYFSVSDDTGGFRIENVPAGRYAVRYSGTGLANAWDPDVVVLPGAITGLEPRELAPDTAAVDAESP